MSDDLYQIEKDLLLEGINRRYGDDFRGYAEALKPSPLIKTKCCAIPSAWSG